MNSVSPSRCVSSRNWPGALRPHALGRRSIARQKGVTTLGFIILAIFVAIFAFGALRLVPIYLNYMKVVGVVDGVRSEFDGQKPTRAAIRKSIARRFDVESVTKLKAKDVKVTPVDGGIEVAAVYDHTSPFIGNISFTVHFDKSELVRR